MLLHTVNKSPFEKNTLLTCLGHVKDGASVLMIEDGIYGSLKGTSMTDEVAKSVAKVKVYVLGPDLKARGMTADHVINGIEVVDYTKFVDLVVKHDSVQSWM